MYPTLYVFDDFLENSSECHVATQSCSNANCAPSINDVIDRYQIIYYFYIPQFFNLECYIVTTLNVLLHKANIFPRQKNALIFGNTPQSWQRWKEALKTVKYIEIS